jgi:hypothetical protein
LNVLSHLSIVVLTRALDRTHAVDGRLRRDQGISDSLMIPPTAVYLTTKVHTSILENSSVVKQLQAFLKGYPPKREYPHDADIVSQIRWLWNQLPRFHHKVSWVKAHQDEKTLFHLLDLPAQPA